MKKNDLIEIKNTSQENLVKKMSVLKDELSKLVIERNRGKLSNIKLVGKKRKDIAQINTIMRQKQLLKDLENNMNKPIEEGGKSKVKSKDESANKTKS